MKSVLTLLAAFTLIASANAASENTFTANTTASHWSISGNSNMSFSSTMQSGADTTNVFGLSASGQYFFMDNASAGLSASYGTRTGLYNMGVGPAATYYIYNSDRIGVPVTAGMMWNYTNADITVLNQTSTVTGSYMTTNVGAGIQYFVIEELAVGPSVNWTHTFESTTSDIKTATSNNVALNLGLSVLL